MTSFDEVPPISLLPVMTKVLVRQIKTNLQKYNILPFRQSGFRQSYSCLTALLDLVDDILRHTDDKNVNAVVLLDFCMAFDKINYKSLVSILSY